ncbi:MAG: aromatic amino acid hydroxylase [Bacteroidetes bacterium]|nr:MAG: aromatic amino acid hydroxylase [Bacteroidota bacterium]
MTANPIIENLPKHLRSFIVEQHYEKYTPQDQAVWRYVMRQNINYLGEVAHTSYLEGLSKAGISAEQLPSIECMNDILAEIGWAAVAVDGFIPPSAFMEFQMHHVLVIAADIRPYNQIEYTPAPDIIHEAAGHAPIIADPEYAEYLRYFGEIGSKAFSSKKDYEMYEAIRHLSILKADPNSAATSIKEAEDKLGELSSEMGMASEMALIRNLHWWTVEYGLIGNLDNPKIYGAGLLSSIGESVDALKKNVIKLPYSIDAIDYNFDITKPQPQLFVTPNFKHLTDVLDNFANQMALRTGGLDGIMKAIDSGNTATIEYESGLQVSGTFTDTMIHNGRAIYINTSGATTLNFKNRMLKGHSKKVHKDGFGSPIGKIKGSLKPTRLLTDNDLRELGITKGMYCKFEFESGIKVEGTLLNTLRKEAKLLLLSFADCKVKHQRKTLFEPSWGIYDMAIGEKIRSAFSGPADASGFGLKYKAPIEKTHKIKYNSKAKELHRLYAGVRQIREENNNYNDLAEIWNNIKTRQQGEWLLPLEILELLKDNYQNPGLKKDIKNYLSELKNSKPEFSKLINNGLKLL